MKKKVLVILADGFEEIEAIVPIDVLKRAELDVVLAGLNGKEVTGSHGLRVHVDILLSEYRDLPDAVILPGGLPGAKHLEESEPVLVLLKRMNQQKKLVGAICASPAFALTRSGILKGRKATCYPGFERRFSKETTFLEDRVVIDQNITTSRGPGSALEFALALVEQLVSKEKAQSLQEALLA